MVEKKICWQIFDFDAEWATVSAWELEGNVRGLELELGTVVEVLGFDEAQIRKEEKFKNTVNSISYNCMQNWNEWMRWEVLRC